MKQAATLLLLVFVGAASPYEQSFWSTPGNGIDLAVFGQLRRLKIEPAKPCSDAVFLRRVYLDVIGTLPTAQEAKDFLADQRPNERHLLIEQLLERDEFAEYQAMRWCDALRVKSEFPINLWPNAVQAYHRWIRTSLRENKRCDLFVREMLTASGSNFRVPAANFYRAVQSKTPQGIAQTVALSFMGCRAENWPKEKLAGIEVFFSQIGYKPTGEWKEEIVFFDPSKATTRPADFVLSFPDGTPAQLKTERDPREDFAAWLTSSKNPYFAPAMVNRVWFWQMGRGVVQECDDFREDNPPSNPALLAHLEREFIASGFDLKQLYRQILHSRTYQLSSVYPDDSAAAAAKFAHYPLRRLEAEVLIDAICQITGTSEKYTSAIPEPYTFMPDDQRALELGDGSITSSFLELFGRPPRDTGFGSERNNRISGDQRLHLLNSTHIQRKIEQGPKMRALARMKPNERLNELYLMILSRYPTVEEREVARSYATTRPSEQRESWTDLAWALMNSSEFLYRH